MDFRCLKTGIHIKFADLTFAGDFYLSGADLTLIASPAGFKEPEQFLDAEVIDQYEIAPRVWRCRIKPTAQFREWFIKWNGPVAVTCLSQGVILIFRRT